MSGPPTVQVTGFDHLVLIVADVEASLAWYTETLGLAAERLEEWRRGEVPFPSVRIDATTIIDFFGGTAPTAGDIDARSPNVDHVALVIDGDVDQLAAEARLRVVRGPLDVFGAQGIGRGIYVNDPDGNIVELRSYPR